MPSQYPVLGNKPIDQWRVAELRDELKRRKLVTKGLKEELVKRLTEAVQKEMESEEGGELSDDVMADKDSQSNSDKEDEDAENKDNCRTESDVNSNGGDGIQGSGDQKEDETDKSDLAKKDEENATTTRDPEKSPSNNQNAIHQTVTQAEGAETDQKYEDSSPFIADSVAFQSDPGNQVSEVSQDLGFQVKYESNSIDSVFINEKNNIKDNLIADNFKLELEVIKEEVLQPSSTKYPTVSGDSCIVVDEKVSGDSLVMEEQGARKNLDFDGEEMDVKHLTEKQVTTSYTTTSDKDFCHNYMSVTKEVVVEHSTSESADILNASYLELPRKEDIVEAGSPEKLNLDRSPGEELVEEDLLERKHVEEDLKFEERTAYHATSKFSPEVNVTDVEYGEPVVPIEKRKLEESEAGVSIGAPKRQRRWNLDTIKVPEEQTPHLSSSTTPKINVEPTVHRTFSQSNSIQSVGSSKERIVPTSRKPASTSLRIDNFLRPFTLKAVQELLSNTGKVCDFWMDHIKTHCYVTYSTVEEAIETRNAIYNLQWPPNGGRLLAAEFVDSQEVKVRLNSPLQPPAPTSGHPLTNKTAPYPQTQVAEPIRLHGFRQQPLPSAPPLAQLTLPPPPLNPPIAREHLPPPPKKPEPPLVTLDDLFKKTKATPRIYYLPLSEQQVASKLAAQGMNL